MAYDRPSELEEALALLRDRRPLILAGGTDLYPATEAPELTGPVLDITGLAALEGISETDTHWRLGATTRWADLIATPLPPAFDALKAAGRELGAIQIQHAATLAGNLCNASPAADGVPALLILDAEIELASLAGRRRLALEAFLTGPRRTALRPDELVTAILVAKQATTGRAVFAKLGARRYLVISIAMVAIRLALEEGRVRAPAVAVGACGPVACRLGGLEAELNGQPLAEARRSLAAHDLAETLAPIDDLRASAGYRLVAARELLLRCFDELVAESGA